MYRLMRNIHLILGLVFVLFLGVYAVSSVRFGHPSWFRRPPQVAEAMLAVDPMHADTPRALGLHLIRDHELKGELFRVQPVENGVFRFFIRRPGTNYQVEYTKGDAEAKVKTTRQDFSGMLTAMHIAHGLWHENPIMNLWGVVVLLTSLGLFALGGTGIYLWFKMYDERLVGGILLIVGLGYGLATMFLVRSMG